jgi:hypothetical protein
VLLFGYGSGDENAKVTDRIVDRVDDGLLGKPTLGPQSEELAGIEVLLSLLGAQQRVEKSRAPTPLAQCVSSDVP